MPAGFSDTTAALFLTVASLLVSLLAALAAGRVLVPLLQSLKARQFISTDAPERHQGKSGTPTMGGTIILAGAFVTLLLFLRPVGDLRALVGVGLATLAFGLIGFLDDLLIVLRGRNLGLRAREKLAGQFLVAILFAVWLRASGLAAPAPGDGGWVALAWGAFHVLLLVGMSNAVNLTDGLDGLAAGVSLPIWLVLAVLAGLAGQAGQAGQPPGDAGLALFCAAFAGATLGYLWYNAHPAQVFMGDTGSLAIGGGLAAAAVAMQQEWALIVASLVPIVEAGSVTLQVISFKTTGRRIFKMSPLHHHFELCDWPETRIVARFAIASAAAGLLALLLVFGWR